MNLRIAPFAFFLIVSAALALGPPAARAASQNPADLPAGRYVLDRQHGSVLAKVMHLGVSLFTVRFDRFEGAFTYDPAHPDSASVTASVEAASLDAGGPYSGKFADDFLDARQFPNVTFVSTQIRRDPDGRSGVMTGDLTLRGVTRPVTFQVSFIGVGKGLLGAGTVTGFSAQAKIKRSEFGSTYLAHWVGDDVTLIIEAEFDKT